MQRRIYGMSTDTVIAPLNEERAVQAAAGLLGELFIFTVAGAAVIYEVQRNSRAEGRKEEQRKQEIEALDQRNSDLEKEVMELRQKLQQVEALYNRSFLDYFKLWQWGTQRLNSQAHGQKQHTEYQGYIYMGQSA